MYQKWYGAGKTPVYYEAFEICEYGAQPDEARIRRTVPDVASCLRIRDLNTQASRATVGRRSDAAAGRTLSAGTAGSRDAPCDRSCP